MQILGLDIIQKKLNEKKRIRRRRYWIHEINLQRNTYGEYHTIYRKLLQDSERYHLYFRMNETQFEDIHNFIKNDNKKKTTCRDAISTQEDWQCASGNKNIIVLVLIYCR